MKRKLLIAAVLFAAVQVKAQVAVVNGQKVIASVKEFAKIDTLVAKETAVYQTEFNKRQQVLNKLVATADSLFKIDQKSASTSKAIADAQAADRELKVYLDQANQKVESYKQTLLKPHTDKVLNTIKVVAGRGKYLQVLDNSAINFLYVNPTTDITDQVIKELKLK